MFLKNLSQNKIKKQTNYNNPEVNNIYPVKKALH